MDWNRDILNKIANDAELSTEIITPSTPVAFKYYAGNMDYTIRTTALQAAQLIAMDIQAVFDWRANKQTQRAIYKQTGLGIYLDGSSFRIGYIHSINNDTGKINDDDLERNQSFKDMINQQRGIVKNQYDSNVGASPADADHPMWKI